MFYLINPTLKHNSDFVWTVMLKSPSKRAKVISYLQKSRDIIWLSYTEWLNFLASRNLGWYLLPTPTSPCALYLLLYNLFLSPCNDSQFFIKLHSHNFTRNTRQYWNNSHTRITAHQIIRYFSCLFVFHSVGSKITANLLKVLRGRVHVDVMMYIYVTYMFCSRTPSTESLR